MVQYIHIFQTLPLFSQNKRSQGYMVGPLAWLKQPETVQFSLVPLLVGNCSLNINTPTHVLDVCVGVCLTDLISHQTVLQQQDQQSEGGRKQPWHWTHLEPHFQVPGTLRPVLLSHGKQWGEKMGPTQPFPAIKTQTHHWGVHSVTHTTYHSQSCTDFKWHKHTLKTLHVHAQT